MPNKAAMYWYTAHKEEIERKALAQRLEDEKVALSRLEQKLSEKKLTELEDFDDDIASRIYSLLTRINAEKRIEYVFLAELVRNYYVKQLKGPHPIIAKLIVENAMARLRVDTMQNIYKLEPIQPCV
jgi:hypothetical protein